jgi:hypothetical protein
LPAQIGDNALEDVFGNAAPDCAGLVGAGAPIRIEAVGHERQNIDFLYLFWSFSVYALDNHRRNFFSRLDGSRHLKSLGAAPCQSDINIRNQLQFHYIMGRNR